MCLSESKKEREREGERERERERERGGERERGRDRPEGVRASLEMKVQFSQTHNSLVQ